MANNPVSDIDPDGGQVPVFEPGKEPRGLLEHKRERDDQSGAYARDEVQKRYRDEIENICKEYLVRGLGADIPGYLNAIKATNDLYCGLSEAFHWMGFGGVASGLDYLTQNQIGNNQMLCLRNGMQSESAGMPMKVETEPMENNMASWAANRAYESCKRQCESLKDRTDQSSLNI